MQVAAPQPFSYRKHFKTAHLTGLYCFHPFLPVSPVSCVVESNWRHSGRLLRSHCSQDAGVVTSLAMDGQWIVVGLANSRVHVFSASTGVLARTLIGHEAGVWSLWLISRGGGVKHESVDTPTHTGKSESNPNARPDESWPSMIPQSLRAGVGRRTGSSSTSSSGSSSSSSGSGNMPFQSVFDSLRAPSSEAGGSRAEGEDPTARQSDPCSASRGWGQPNALVVSGGCDKQIRIWDVKSGCVWVLCCDEGNMTDLVSARYCLYVLRGHRSTIRCIKVFHGRSVAVSGSRDRTLRVWDVQKGVRCNCLSCHKSDWQLCRCC